MFKKVLVLLVLILLANFAFAEYNQQMYKQQAQIYANNQIQQKISELKNLLNDPRLTQEQKAEIRKVINELEQAPAKEQEAKQEQEKIVKEQEQIKKDSQNYIDNENKKREEAKKHNFKVITWNGFTFPGLIINNVKYFIIPSNTIKLPFPPSNQSVNEFNEQYNANLEKYGCMSINSSWVNSYEFPNGRDVEELLIYSNEGSDSFSFHHTLAFFKDSYIKRHMDWELKTNLARKTKTNEYNRVDLICRIDYPVLVEYDAAGRMIVKIKEKAN